MTHTLALLGAGPQTVQFLTITLPPGISFYTFQEVAYIVDVYSGKLEPAGYYRDGFHLNAKGAERFTSAIIGELMK